MDKLLRVNLSTGNCQEEMIPAEIRNKYLGGKGLIAYYLYHELDQNCDPLGAANKLMFFTGPLTGLMPGYDRFVVGAKSPLTNTFSDSYAGGWFSVSLKKAGYLGLIVEGKAAQPVYLRIEGDHAEIVDAAKYAGMNTSELDQALPGFRVAAIGPAGENLVKYACIVSNPAKGGRTGVAGRGGLGAVMGSKNLKAVAVKPVQDYIKPLFEQTKQIRREATAHIKENVMPLMGLGGNLGAVDLSAKAKVLPVNNFQRGFTENYVAVNEAAVGKVTTKKNSCHICPAACGVEISVSTGQFSEVELDRLEYETIAMCGTNCGHHNLSSIAALNLFCNEYGLDVISAGNVVAFAMECAEKGLIDHDIRFGDLPRQIGLLEQIVNKKGLGALLAEGVSPAAKEIGGGAEELALHVKGLEIPGYDPRGSISQGLAYGTSDRGGCHMRAWSIASDAFLNVEYGIQEADPFTIEGKAGLVKELQDLNAALWCLISCDNLGYTPEYALKMLKAIGISLSREEFIKTGERICNLAQLFNHREGFSREDDYLPQRFYESREDTGWKIEKNQYDLMLSEYYQLRRWDQKGKPTDAILKELKIQV